MMTDPTRHLAQPIPQDDSIENHFVNLTSFLDYVSLSAWTNEIIEDLTGYDVIGSLIEPFAGDWAAVSTYGDALKKMSPLPRRDRRTDRVQLLRPAAGMATLPTVRKRTSYPPRLLLPPTRRHW